MAGVNKALPVSSPLPGPDAAPPPWQALWPNPADVPYNYFNLLDRTARSGIANVSGQPASKLRIGIVGTGFAGLTAARELFRSGFSNITLYEADDRLGGRGYPVLPQPASGTGPGGGLTPFELGAMRIPFFDPQVAGAEGRGNSCTAFYAGRYGVQTQAFPDPGSPNMTTGIFMNEGYGPTPDPERFLGILRWNPTDKDPAPPTPALESVYAAWTAWANNVQQWVGRIYGSGQAWFDYWHRIVETYELDNFRDVALAPPKIYYRPDGSVDDRYRTANANGDFGGLGLTTEQADLFYTIGAGDGSWGAFFDIAALYPMRTLLFGYANQHQLLGYVDWTKTEGGKVEAQAPEEAYFFDSAGRRVQWPLFAGLTAVPAMHFFQTVASMVPGVDGQSLWIRMLQDKDRPDGVKLFTSSPVRGIDVSGSGYVVTTGAGGQAYHDVLIFTPPGWALQMNVDLSPAFMKKVFIQPGGNDFWPPLTSLHGLKMSHNITSAKVFFKLKQRYWTTSSIPQVLVTDTFLQDVYGYAIDRDENGNPVDDAGVLLCSYTWEDDSNKFLASHTGLDDQELARKCLAKLDEILVSSGYPAMSNFVDFDYAPVAWHWEEQPFYRSCAKLYRAGSFDWNYAQLTWNQNHSRERSVYFAGEFASLEGGWIEPAMRGALDAVVNLVKNTVPQQDWPRVFADYEMIQNYVKIPNWRPQPAKSGQAAAE